MKNKSNVRRPKLMMNLPNATGLAPIKLPFLFNWAQKKEAEGAE
jgi:hypothetical protein